MALEGPAETESETPESVIMAMTFKPGTKDSDARSEGVLVGLSIGLLL